MIHKPSFLPSLRVAVSNLCLRAVRSDLLHQGGVDV